MRARKERRLSRVLQVHVSRIIARLDDGLVTNMGFVSVLRRNRYTVDLKCGQQLQAAQTKQQSDDAKAAEVAAAQSQIAATSASVQTATAALLQALQESGSGTSGTLVSTSA
jgi:uncharacterized protein YceH (UPF0502 family)